MKFCKMNGCGNDYIFVYLPENKVTNPKELAVRLSERHFGVGSDGLVLIDKSQLADCSMRIFNADGSEANMCGNALRCAAKYIYDRGFVTKDEVSVCTLAGVKTVRLDINGGKAESAKADLGAPSLMKLGGKRAVSRTVTAGGKEYEITPIDVGNFHAVRFVKRITQKEMGIAKAISTNCPQFPDGVNVEAARVIDRGNIEVRVYERGSGETLACGTGAAATLFAAFLKGLTGPKANIILPGGVLEVEYIKGRVYVKGPAKVNFEGEIKDL